MSKRKARIDSAGEAVRVMGKAGTKEVAPPPNVPLDAEDLPFFQSVIAEYARSEWSAHQLELAAMARTMADLTREQQLLRTEGGVAYSEKGTPVAEIRARRLCRCTPPRFFRSADRCPFTRARKRARRGTSPRGAALQRQSRQTTR